MSENLTLPVIPLRSAVLFPGVAFPISAGRAGTLQAIEAAMRSPEHLVFAVTQREDGDKVSPETLHAVGTIAAIGSLQRGLGGARLLLHGRRRGVAVRYMADGAMIDATVAEASEMKPGDLHDPEFLALYKEARERAAELGKKLGLPDDAVARVLADVDDPGLLADLVAGYLDLPAGERQRLLETLSVEERLRRVIVHVRRQIGVLSAQEDIQSKVQEELGGLQREMFLREQLKAIQKELGEGEGRDAEDLRELKAKLDALELPAEARREIDREWSRLSRLSRESLEAQVARSYLETVAELPWNARSADVLDVKEAQRILEEDHHGLEEVKDRILEFLSVRQLLGSAKGKGRILLFVGPPGVGKTSIAKSIARSMGRKYVRVSLGGVRDESDIRGHRRTYVGAMAGRILQGMKQAGTRNPVFLLDEIDKLGISLHGDPASALLEVLDPAQNDTFVDHYLGVPFDLSEVLFIATANVPQGIPGPLLDRLELVEFSGYTEREKLAIARRYLVPRQLADAGLDAGRLAISDDALGAIISGYTREAGVRQLERELGRVARKVARRIAAHEAESMAIGPDEVAALLGKQRVHPERKHRDEQAGVATGMYYTPAGGDIMFVEAALMRGHGDVILTGQLGDVMKESARAAWTYARSRATGLEIEEDSAGRELHVHVPAGAIPKDGPSAGLAMATAIISALAHRPVRHDVAMTGEITLTGRVLPIGGVKEKVLGAVRAGIREIVLPRENEADLRDLPDDVRAQLTIHLVESIPEVLGITLRGISIDKDGVLSDGGRPAALSHGGLFPKGAGGGVET